MATAQALDPKVREYHAIGTELLEQYEEARAAAGYHGEKWVNEQAKSRQMRTEVLYRILQLASSYEGKKVQSLGALTWGKVVFLLSVRDDDRRSKLTSQAIAKRWTARELKRQVRRCKARRPQRDRDREPGTMDDELVELETLSRSWLRRVSSKAWSRKRRSELGRFPLHDNKLSECLRRAERAMKKLIEQIVLALPDPEPRRSNTAGKS
jgi:hypothetical protein